MGLFDKVKSILFDEEEVEIPVIKETKKEKVKEDYKEDIIKEIKVPKEDFSDKDNYKSESTFTFPIDFDDEEPIPEVKKIEQKKEEKKYIEEYKYVSKPEKKDYSDFLRKHDEKKKFKPTPIISPVYGVLDQNYKKEDVIVKKDVLRRPNEISLDEVRKKAFGTLEDEIDANLVNSDIDVIKTKEEVKIKKEQVIENKKDIEVEKPIDRLKTIGELIEEDSYEIDIPEVEDSINIEEIDNTNNIDIELEEPKNTINDLLEENVINEEVKSNEIDEEEEDLFSLIDSMYEEKGE